MLPLHSSVQHLIFSLLLLILLQFGHLVSTSAPGHFSRPPPSSRSGVALPPPPRPCLIKCMCLWCVGSVCDVSALSLSVSSLCLLLFVPALPHSVSSFLSSARPLSSLFSRRALSHLRRRAGPSRPVQCCFVSSLPTTTATTTPKPRFVSALCTLSLSGREQNPVKQITVISAHTTLLFTPSHLSFLQQCPQCTPPVFNRCNLFVFIISSSPWCFALCCVFLCFPSSPLQLSEWWCPASRSQPFS